MSEAVRARLDLANLSPRERFAILPRAEREQLLGKMSPEQVETLQWSWGWIAHPKQRIPEGDWQIWLLRGGRGSGKTRAGAEAVYEWVRQGRTRFALLGRTAADVRDTMLYGESGIMNIGPPGERPEHIATSRRLRWKGGAEAILYTADEPKQLRGPQHQCAWVDELAQFRYPDAWDQLLLGLRLPPDPKVVVTTTPRPTPLIRSLHHDPTCFITPMTTYENVQNLAESWQQRIIRRYEGTRLGRQELMAEMLMDVPGALWTSAMLDATRDMRDPVKLRDMMVRIVVAVDPPSGGTGTPMVTKGGLTPEEREEENAECGIVVVGRDERGHGYTLEDATVASSKPEVWGAAVVDAYRRWRADRVVAESNNGGEMVGYVIAVHDPRVPVRLVWASRGKQTRAEPVSALFAQGTAHHAGFMPDLEMQETTWVPGEPSPDRMDAEVWGYSALYFDIEQEQVYTYEEPAQISPF